MLRTSLRTNAGHTTAEVVSRTPGCVTVLRDDSVKICRSVLDAAHSWGRVSPNGFEGFVTSEKWSLKVVTSLDHHRAKPWMPEWILSLKEPPLKLSLIHSWRRLPSGDGPNVHLNPLRELLLEVRSTSIQNSIAIFF